MTTSDELLRQGIEAAKAGQVTKAHGLLKQVVEREPQNEKAWLWLSGVVQTDEQRLVCLENVLAINPHNQIAQRGLTVLRQKAIAVEPLPEKAITELPSKKWYREGWFLLFTFFFFMPLWLLIVLTDPDESKGTKVLASIFFVACVIIICPVITREFMITMPLLTPTPTLSQVTYQVTGSARRASLLYWTADGMEERTVDLPWKKSFKAQGYQIMSIVAQNEGDAGSIKCEILVNGKLIKTATSQGAYVGVSCGP